MCCRGRIEFARGVARGFQIPPFRIGNCINSPKRQFYQEINAEGGAEWWTEGGGGAEGSLTIRTRHFSERQRNWAIPPPK